LNIDVAVAGSHPLFAATPELHELGRETMKKIMWPAFGGNETMYDVWLHDTKGKIDILGTGSDYTAFVHSGVAVIDVSCASGRYRDP
jgi:N-acetylated-alpha-linked acidic dipeptidase